MDIRPPKALAGAAGIQAGTPAGVIAAPVAEAFKYIQVGDLNYKPVLV